MLLRAWKSVSKVPIRQRVRPRQRRLLLESLEERTVLSTVLLRAGDEGRALVLDPASYHPSRVLVGLRPGAESAGDQRWHGTPVASARPLAGGLWEVDLGAGTSVPSALASLRCSFWVDYVEPDYTVRVATVPSDPQFSSLWGLNNTGQTGGTPDADIDAARAWDLTTGSSSTIVAVIDTGVDYNHPDLAANIWTNAGEIPGDNIDNDGNGFVDDVHGYDFINNDGNPQDDQGHGTHVAGTIGAVANNGLGVAGINWNVQIMPLKFLGADGSGSISDAIRALDYAVQMGAHISNNSYGDAEFSQAFADAIADAGDEGHVFVAAAGNNAGNNDASPFYPASFDATNIISVAATDHNDQLASFSNYGATKVDIAAPGVNILSTSPGNSYQTLSGTSMASPHVAGVVSLVHGLHPEWSVQQIIDEVLNSADFLTNLEPVTVTGGRLNAAGAVGVPDTDGPRVTAVDPAGATGGPVSRVRMSFSESVDPASFTAADIVSFTGPGGSIPITGVSAVAGSRERKFDITFAAQFVKGTYELLLGPSIFDASGNPMNQDGDAVNGEVPDDQYLVSFVIGDVHVIHADDVPLPLTMFAKTTSTLAIDQNLSIADLDVQLDISYPDVGLLSLTLVSPGGTRIPLAETRGFLGPNYDDTIFDDEAAQSINEGSPPYAGSYRPAAPLSALDGTSALGTWKLEVYDLWFDPGTLNSWSLLIIPHPPRVTVSDADLVEGNAGTSSAVFTVSLSNVIGEAVTVDFATAGGTATAGSDYTAVSGTLTFAPGELTKTIDVPIHGDTLDEPDETFFLNLSNVANATLADAQAAGTIVNDEAILAVSDVTLAEGNSGAVSALFTITLATASSQTITASYATANGTATAGSDYVAASGSVAFAPGQTSQSVSVTVNGDSANEADETFSLNLVGATNAVVGDGQGIGTIANDDPLPALSVNDVKISEGNSGTKNLSFTVNLAGASGRIVTVDYESIAGSATPGSDYTPFSGTLAFNPGQNTKYVTVVLIGDAVPEPDETFVLQLSNPSGAIFLDAAGTGTIQNDDVSLTIGDASVAEGDSGIDELAFPVTLSTAVDFEVRVNYATGGGNASSGSDYIGAGGTLVFAPGQTTQAINVLVLGDIRNELDETFQLNLTNPIGVLLADGQGIATILDDDPLPAFSVADASMVEGNAGTRTLNFTVSLSAPSGKTVTVQYATADGTATAGSDYVSKSGTLTFLAGSTSQGVSVTVNGDTAAELNETVRLTISNPANATLGDSEANGKILDDDLLSISDAFVAEGDSGTQEAVFTIALAMPLAQEVRLNYATANGTASAGSDYVYTSGTVVFAPGETVRSIAVSVIGDLRDEADETLSLNLSSPVNIQLVDTQAIATIIDDDASPEVIVSDVTVVEGNSGSKNLSFAVSLSAVSNQTVTVQYATADGTATAGSDYVPRSGALTFYTGSIFQTVNVTISGDTAAEPNETVLFNLIAATNAAIADAQGIGTIASDDPLPAMTIGDAKVAEGNALTKTLSFNVVLSAAAGATPITVNYATTGQTATSGSDFTSTSGTLTFTSGQSSKWISVPILGDTLAEADETFLVTLDSASGATIVDGDGLGTITTDDTALRVSDATVSEGDSGIRELTFNVTLPAPVDFEVRVNYATANSNAWAGADYVGTGGTLVFAPGQTSLPVTVLALGDVGDESDEWFYLNLTSPTNAYIADGQGWGWILDDDATPTLSISDTAIAEGASGTRNLVFTVALSAISGRTSTVNYATANGTATAGSDYQAKSGTLTLLAGWSSATISVPINGDASAEGDETLLVNLSGAIGATLADSQGLGTILEDDNLSIGDAVLVEGNGGVSYAEFIVALAIPLAAEVRLNYATANGSASAGSDYLATSGTVVLAPGETSQTVRVPVLGDRANEADETFYVNFTNPVGIIPGDTQAAATITNDDSLPGLSVSDAVIVEGNWGTRTLWFTISLSEVSGRTINVSYATTDGTATAGSDYVARSGMLTFLPGWISQTISVTVSSDALLEEDEFFTLELFGEINALIADGSGQGRILSDDQDDGIQAASADAYFAELGG